jgi:peptidoglycan/xylan/chitin deacetylase (PgdA/CDA1 family)
MLRDTIKAGIASALHWSGTDKLIGALSGPRRLPVVFGYHRVVEDIRAHAERSIPAMLISRAMLERHLDWIGRHYRMVPLEELEVRLEAGEGFDEPVAAITFDDGYRDVYENGFPLLRRMGIPAAVFVVTDPVGTSRVPLHDKLYLLLAQAFTAWRSAPRELTRVLRGLDIRLSDRQMATMAEIPLSTMRALYTALPQTEIQRVIDTLESEIGINEGELNEYHPLSWEMLAEMHRAGIAIGSHTRTHPLLTSEGLARVGEETEGSRRELEGKLGIPIRYFAYPDGRFNIETVRAVAAAGYRLAFTTCQHRDREHPLLTLPRTLLWENSSVDGIGRFSPAVMSCQANGALDLISRCRQNHGRAGCDGAPSAVRQSADTRVGGR